MEKQKPRIRHASAGSVAFDVFNYLFLTLFAAVTLIPFLHVVGGSMTTAMELATRQLVIIPRVLTLEAYKLVLGTNSVVRALGVSVGLTIVGTAFNMVMTSLMAYALSIKTLQFRRQIMFMVTFTMIFSGGMIPGYLVVRALGLIDTYAALILPGAISAFNMIMLRNFFQSIPLEMRESAWLDGANELRILTQIILPLSLPALATFTLFYAVSHWNSYFSAILYINKAEMWPIQVILRQVVMLAQGTGTSDTMDSYVTVPAESVKMATIVVSMLPILVVYPFLQRYFMTGLLVGSVKG